MSVLNSYLSDESIPCLEELLTENVEQAELIQRLLSEKSELQQIVREQRLTLQELKENIVTLNNSDLQLKEAEQKLKESKQNLVEVENLKKTMIEADRSRKQFYEKSVRELTLRESNATKREKQAKYFMDNQNRVLDEKAKQLTSSVRDSMEKQYQKREKALCEAYKSKVIQLHAVTVGGLLYSLYVTLLMVTTTIRFKSDFKAFVEGIYNVISCTWKNLLLWANTVSCKCKNIPNETVATVLSWFVHWLIIVLVLAIIIGGIGLGIYKMFKFYILNFADRLSVVVLLLSFSILVWFGDYIGSVIIWNLLLIFLIIQVAYILVRMYVECRK